MKIMRDSLMAAHWWLAQGSFGMAVVLACVLATASPAISALGSLTRDQAIKAMRDGNAKDAYEAFRTLAFDPQDDPAKVGDDLQMATQCLQTLARDQEIDSFREGVITIHGKNWRLLHAAARNYLEVSHQGFLVAGKFQRGPHRGGGQWASALARDRVRALQLMTQAIPLARQEKDRSDRAASFFLDLARMLLSGQGGNEAWRLQSLTDLTTLPDYEPGWGYHQPTRGAPVDAQGNPVYYSTPKRFETAASDGQRWRWCLAEAAELDASLLQATRMQLADFLRAQFGVQTMAHFGWQFGRMDTDDSKEDTSGPYALASLKDTETIARLATGIKRFAMPEEFNYIKIYQQVADEAKGEIQHDALVQLATVFENRRQYPRAADHWRKVIALAGPWQHKEQLDQIVGNWGRFEQIVTQPAGKGATLEYRFRNGRQVEFTAQEICVDKLLDDVKAYLKSQPKEFDWSKANIGDLGFRLVMERQKKYVGDKVAQWRLDLEPRPQHFDRRITVTTPLSKPGAYLLRADMTGGNTCYLIVWLADTVIAKKPLAGKTLYYVADAVTGKPIPKANVEFFGYKMEWQSNKHRNWQEIQTRQFAESTDADGQVFVEASDLTQRYQWLVIARAPENRFAYLGFTQTWSGRYHDADYNATKVYTITDRPVYRPGQAVHYKLWIRHAKYDQEDISDYANANFVLRIFNPKGEKTEVRVKADAYGGIEGKYDLPADATLGVYRLTVLGHSREGGSFRVEEYKKPEYEVTVDAPKEPVMLGDKIEATIKAKYYFGSPVTKAKVKYKVQRTDFQDRWCPAAPWDWLYGAGYWWFAYDYDWYPGWKSWGFCRPAPFWWPRAHVPPEVVAEREVEIGPDGAVKVEIDTAVAKAIHPDKDHSYSITAEVVDQSRRTIVGSGTVLAARKPFKVFAWVDHGYYRAGDVIAAHFTARTLDGKPVQGQGKLTLLEIRYEDGKPVEKMVEEADLPTNEQGAASHQLRAAHAGQYRLAYRVTDAKGHAIDGGYVLTVIGDDFRQGTDFRFNSVELVPDKREYQPGEKVRLMINTDRAGGTVLLFLRPSNGVYLPPKVVRLEGKSTVEAIEVSKKDMPNFFVEALVVADGKVYTEVKEIVVPPEKRVLGVDIVPSATAYKPGQKAKVQLKLTDYAGKPFEGSTVVAIYDKSLEYISGGSNVPEIKAFFWKWRRNHHPSTESTLQRSFRNLVAPGTLGMNDIGVFGGTEVNETTLAGGAGAGFGAVGRGQRKNDYMMNSSMMADGIDKGGFAMPSAPRAAPMMAGRTAGLAAKADMAMEGAEAGEKQKAAPGGAEAPMVQPAVRTKFADTALWVGVLSTDANGAAEVSLDMPENLTTWRIKVWGMGHGTRVGEGFCDVVTRKDLIIRLQAPRFFVQKDEVVLSANVHNYLKGKKDVQVVLEIDELGGAATTSLDAKVERTDAKLRASKQPGWESPKKATVEAGGERRIDWRIRIDRPGEIAVRMKALTDEESDAMEQKFPCYVHGMLKTEAWSGVIRPKDQSGKFTVSVPAERLPEQSRLEVRYSPTLAGAMVDALPYMVDYPYGCTEQTLNRFLPTVITQKVLARMGLDLEEIGKKRTNLNAQEIGDDRDRAKQWKRLPRNPVFDTEEVRKMVKDGVERLTEMQLSDGGWGWFSGWGEFSSPHTTAQVVHGLQIAQANDVALVPGMLDRGVAWLVRYQDKQVELLKNAEKTPKPQDYKEHADNLDAFVYMVLVDAGVKNGTMKDFLYRDRSHLAVYGMAMVGLALEKQGDKDKLAMVMQNIGQYVQQDDENQTAWLRLPEGNYWWCWYGSEYEAMASYLKLLSRTDPQGAVAPRLVKYLLNNRKHATYWNSTRDTSLVIEAFAEYLKASGEDKPEMTVKVLYDGQLKKAIEITPAVLFGFDNRFVLEGVDVTAGKHEIELQKTGKGPLYFNGYLTNFTLEDSITKAGLEIKVQRKYYRLKEVDAKINAAGSRGQVVGQKIEKYQREPLENLAMLKSGDLVEIELEIASKNDYEYVIFEDMKPAGFEPVEVRSGYNGNAMGAYVEFRDNRVAFFVRQLARGEHSVSYRMRAETPGKFSALPTKAAAMYAPELKANSDEIKLQVEDK